MARGKKAEQDETERKHNWSPADLEKIVEEIEEERKYLSELKAKHKEAEAVVTGRIGGIYKRAKALGLMKKPLKLYIDERANKIKREDLIKALEQDERAIFFEFQRAMGDFVDTPLAQAAAKAQDEAIQKRKSALDDIGAEGLAAGIRPLN
jgi:hypothetical protein